MVKKAFRLDKGSSQNYAGKKIYFATKHEKEKILAPLFKENEMELIAAPIDTDQFGTFSGEVDRKGSVKETLRAKIQACKKEFPKAEMILASEGSFMPHPYLGFLKSNLESLLLWDEQQKIEIYVEHLSLKTDQAVKTFSPSEDYNSFLKEFNFPEHHLIVRPEDSMSPIFKGISDTKILQQSILECLANSKSGRYIISTDQRAHCNPNRQQVILEAGKKLIEKIKCLCPECGAAGFGIINGIPGLECEECGEPTEITKLVLYGCVKCFFEISRLRPDGKLTASASECPRCNP